MAYKIFIESDIILDLFLSREPFLKHAQELLNLYDEKKFELYTSALIINNVYYFVRKEKNSAVAKRAISILVEMIKILAIGGEAVKFAVNSELKDFEDALQVYTATQNNCNAIITRNIKDYKQATIPVLTAEQFLRNILYATTDQYIHFRDR
jgi:predicted nucleic acid-binding protein